MPEEILDSPGPPPAPFTLSRYLAYRNAGHRTAAITSMLAPPIPWAIDLSGA
jgi:hypothetical protein